jgi:hypothetical protein
MTFQRLSRVGFANFKDFPPKQTINGFQSVCSYLGERAGHLAPFPVLDQVTQKLKFFTDFLLTKLKFKSFQDHEKLFFKIKIFKRRGNLVI